MELHLDTGAGQYHIRGYGTDFVQINDEKIKNSVIVTANKLINPWPPQSITDLKAEHFQAIFALHPSIVLLGTGQHLSFPAPELLGEFYNKKIGIEVMNTGAACRTYAILMSEGRNVAAALLLK